MKRTDMTKLLSLVLAFVFALSAGIGVWAEEGMTETPVAEEIVMPEAPANEPAPAEQPQAEIPAEGSPESEAPANEAAAEETPAEAPVPTEEAPVEEVPAEEVPMEEVPVEEVPVEEAPALKKGLALIIKKADVTKKAESHKAAYILSKDALVLAEEIEGNAEKVKVQFILNGEKITGFVEAGAVAFIDGDPDSKYAALAVGNLYEMADYAAEVAEEPVEEAQPEEPAKEEMPEAPATEEPEVTEPEEEVTEEPIVEGPAAEEPVVEEPVTEEPAQEVICSLYERQYNIKNCPKKGAYLWEAIRSIHRN